MALVLGPRAKVHPDRYGATRTGKLRLIVFHTTEGGEGADKAEQLAKACEQPGDRDNGHGGKYGSSYHYVMDTDRVIPLVPENVVSYSAPGANNDGIHCVFPGRAAQTREEWLDPISSAMITQAAELAVDISKRQTILLRRLADAGVLAGWSGYIDHWTVSRCYSRTDHTDVGKFFPWDVLAERIAAIVETKPTPPPEKPPTTPPATGDDMKLGIYPTGDGNGTILTGQCTNSGSAAIVRHVRTEADLVALRANPDALECDGVDGRPGPFGKGQFGSCILLGHLPDGWGLTDFADVIF